MFREFQRLFRMPEAQWETLAAAEALCEKRCDVWATAERWQDQMQAWGSTPLEALDIEQLRNEVPA
jgi:hypothetical protein